MSRKDFSAEDSKLPKAWVDDYGRTADHPYVGNTRWRAIVPQHPLHLDASICVLEDQSRGNINAHKQTSDLTRLYMAQSKTGRNALRYITELDISVGYKENLFQESKGTYALYNFDENQIIYDANIGAPLLSQLLIEEAQHAYDHKILEVTFSSMHGLRSAVMLGRALEASATAKRVLHVEECLLARRRDHLRFLPPDLEEWLNHISPTAAAAGRQNRHLLEKCRTDLFMRSVFQAYYDEGAERATYDKNLLLAYEKFLPETQMLDEDNVRLIHLNGHASYMKNATLNHAYFAARLEVDGRKYLQRSPFSLDDPHYTDLSQSPVVGMALMRLYERLALDPGYLLIQKATGQDIRPSLTTGRIRGLLGTGSQAPALTKPAMD